MINFYKKRSFYEIKNNDAIILNYLFAYKIYVSNFEIKMDITENQKKEVLRFFEDKKISYIIFLDKIQQIKREFKNSNYTLLLNKTQKELPSAYELKEKMLSSKILYDSINSNSPKYKNIDFYQNINSLMDNNKKLNIENIINNYKAENQLNYLSFKDVIKSDLYNNKSNINNNDFDTKNIIKIGSKIMIQKEDSDDIEEYIICKNYDDKSIENGLSIDNTFGKILLGKSEWDFVEYNGEFYQILQVLNK